MRLVYMNMSTLRVVPIGLIEPGRCTRLPNWRDYAAAMRAGANFPPVVIFRMKLPGGYRYRIFDGRHRFRATNHIGRESILAFVGTWKEIAADMSYWENIANGFYVGRAA
jgi:hypothetical protein